MDGFSISFVINMGKTVVVILMVALAMVVEGRDWRFESLERSKRDYHTGFGEDRSDENDNASKERFNVCGQGDRGYGDSRELSYNRDGRSNDNRHGHRSYSQASASASATSSNQNQNHNLRK